MRPICCKVQGFCHKPVRPSCLVAAARMSAILLCCTAGPPGAVSLHYTSCKWHNPLPTSPALPLRLQDEAETSKPLAHLTARAAGDGGEARCLPAALWRRLLRLAAAPHILAP